MLVSLNAKIMMIIMCKLKKKNNRIDLNGVHVYLTFWTRSVALYSMLVEWNDNFMLYIT